MSSEPPCCAFTYDSIQDMGMTRTAVGIGCSWLKLKKRFSRYGPPCPGTNVQHYQTISLLGPKLFAVDLSNFKVFYHNGRQWCQYQSARNVRFGRLEDFQMLLEKDDDVHNNDDDSHDDNDGKDRDDGPGQDTKDSSSNKNSTSRLDQTILYFYCLGILLLVSQCRNALLQYSPMIL